MQDGSNPSEWGGFTWLLAVGMPAFGGIVNWYSRIKKGRSRSFNLVELVGEIFTSGFVGLTVFMILRSYDYSEGISAAIGSYCGHMGTRFLFAIEGIIESRIEALSKNEAEHD